MTKQELMENYTTEQLADMVVKYQNASEVKNDEIQKLKWNIGNLEEDNSRLQAKLDTYNNYLLPRATKEAKEMIDRNRFTDVMIVTYEEWLKQKENNEIDELKQKLERQETATKYAEEYIDSLKCLIDRKQDAINQIDSIICELFGIAHNDDTYLDDFKELLKEKSAVGKTISDFLPEEPIAVAEMLINAEGEYEHNSIMKSLSGQENGTYRLFDISKLRQIAEHLLVYCNHNEEDRE